MMIMAKKQPYDLIYDPEVAAHLDAIESKHHALIRSTIEEQLQFEPEPVMAKHSFWSAGTCHRFGSFFG